MRLRGAVVEEKGMKFAVAAVKRSVIDNRFEAGMTLQCLNAVFPEMNVILMSNDNAEKPEYYGRSDIIELMGDVPHDKLQWQEYTVD